MKKYISPEIEFVELVSSDIISVSGNEQDAAFSISSLEGVDKDGSKSAVFNVSHWLSK